MNHDDVRLEDEIREMFAHRSEKVRASHGPYEAVATRIKVARRRRRQRVGGSLLAVAVVAAGVGAWASQGRGPRSAPPAGPVTGGATFVYDDGVTVIPDAGGQAAAMRQATVDYLASVGQKALTGPGHTIVTTFNPGLMAAAEQVGDQLTRQQVAQLPAGSRLAFVSTDTTTGAVKAFYGGADAFRAQFSIGQLMEPVVVGAALDGGHYGPDSLEPAVNSRPLYFPIGSTRPQDHITYVDDSGREHNWPAPIDDGQGKTVTGMANLAQGLGESLSSVACDLELEPDVTPATVYGFARGLGIAASTLDFFPMPSLCLGPARLSPAQVSEVYAAFAAGVHRAQTTVTKVLDATGQVVWAAAPDGPAPRTSVAMKPKTAIQVDTMLRAAVRSGTGAVNPDLHAYAAKHPGASGKTSTVSDESVSWFAGSDNGLSTAVEVLWPGVDLHAEPAKTLVYGNQLPATVWARFMTLADQERPPQG